MAKYYVRLLCKNKSNLPLICLLSSLSNKWGLGMCFYESFGVGYWVPTYQPTDQQHWRNPNVFGTNIRRRKTRPAKGVLVEPPHQRYHQTNLFETNFTHWKSTFHSLEHFTLLSPRLLSFFLRRVEHQGKKSFGLKFDSIKSLIDCNQCCVHCTVNSPIM